MSSIDLMLGSTELGVLISSCLYGVTTLQAYIYWQNFKGDRCALRITALCIWLVETFHTALLWEFLYYLTVRNFGDITTILRIHWSVYISIPTMHIVAATVQGFFAYRIFCLSRNWLIPCLPWLGLLLRLIGSFAMCIIAFRDKNFDIFIAHDRWLVIGTVITAVAVDVLNATLLCFFLWRMRKNAGRSKQIVQKLIMWTIGQGFLKRPSSCCFLLRHAYRDWSSDELLRDPRAGYPLGRTGKFMVASYCLLYSKAILKQFLRIVRMHQLEMLTSTSIADYLSHDRLNGRASLRETADRTSDAATTGIMASGIRSSGLITLEPTSSSRRTPLTVHIETSQNHRTHEAIIKTSSEPLDGVPDTSPEYCGSKDTTPASRSNLELDVV